MTKRFRFRILIVLFALGAFGMVKAKAQDFTLPLGVGIRALAWNPDYTLLAVANPGGQVWIYTAEGELRTTLRADEIHATSVAWSRDGAYLASGGWEGQFVIWDTVTWEPIQTILAFGDGVFEVSWNADDSLFAASGFDTFQIWETSAWKPQTGGLSVTFQDLEWNPILPIVFGYAGAWFAGVSGFEGSRLEAITNLDLPMSFDRITDLAWSSDGKRLALVSHAWIYVWDAITGERISSIHIDEARFRTINFVTADGVYAIVVTNTGDVYTVDVNAGRAERVATVEGTPLASAWNPVTQTLWIGGVANREDDSPENVILVSLSADDLGLSLPTLTE